MDDYIDEFYKRFCDGPDKEQCPVCKGRGKATTHEVEQWLKNWLDRDFDRLMREEEAEARQVPGEPPRRVKK